LKDTPNIPDISTLLQSIEELRMLCQKQEEIIIDLRASNARLLKENSKLKKEIVELKDQIDSR